MSFIHRLLTVAPRVAKEFLWDRVNFVLEKEPKFRSPIVQVLTARPAFGSRPRTSGAAWPLFSARRADRKGRARHVGKRRNDPAADGIVLKRREIRKVEIGIDLLADHNVVRR